MINPARRPQLEPCDILVFRGGAFISKAIRVLTRSPHEGRSWANHVGFVYDGGFWYSAVIQEAVTKVRRVSLSVYLHRKTEVLIRVYRPLTLGPLDRAEILRSADTTVGQRYGYGKIVLHALDAGLGQIFRRDVKVFRRLGFTGHPICSWDLAHHWLADGLSFGVGADYATPDDIDDFCRAREDRYELIYQGPV